MHLGVFIFLTEYTIRPDELGRALEERGFESLFVPEHTHIPTSRRTPFPGGTELPKEYMHTLDPFVALTASADKQVLADFLACEPNVHQSPDGSARSARTEMVDQSSSAAR